MKRNFDVPLMNSDGRPFVREKLAYDEKGLPIIENNRHKHLGFEPMTLRNYAQDAVGGRWKGEEDMGPDELFKRGKLHDKLSLTPYGEPVDLTNDESKMILDALYKQGASALVYTRMRLMLETDPAPAAKAEPAGVSTGPLTDTCGAIAD